MTKGKVLEGVFAINKPAGLSSAQVLRDLQKHFNPSELFAPWLSVEKHARDREQPNQRKRRRQKEIQVKIGHGGTLDPLATGVLIAGVGKGTKSLASFLECTKTYEAIVLFGAATDSYDRVGKLLKKAPYEHITREMVEKALPQYRGKFMQLPPLYSALKMNGKPLYEYAREGKEIPREIERRPVTVSELELVEWYEGGSHGHEAPTQEASHAEVNVASKLWKQEKVLPASTKDDAKKESRKRKASEEDDLVHERPNSKQKREGEEDHFMSGGLAPPSESPSDVPVPSLEVPLPSTSKGPPAAKIRMTVSSGFYVRSLCHDLGAAVGSAALMAELVRTRQAQFELGKNVLDYDELEKGEKVWAPIVESMLDDWEEGKTPGTSSSKEENSKVEEEKVKGEEAKKETEEVEDVKKETPEAAKEPESEGVEAIQKEAGTA